ncbi:hypothetical protein TRFO_06073 [Tritrichomonas foetus]|uniref:Uncharacterized protein n=1 Tax=Tritrichomonas foetus TaxID=1144522 RepID=A0A1J4K0W8_9EUKA|nr:hypothetical protein TRFO_06073 [Tritrichomonas foetus]|eukprot:OHT05073.1 hypothetical protein TRFO_06073 [Tritrichomonas foetus]
MLAEVSDNSNEESSIKVSDTFLIGEQDETLHNEQEQTLEPKIVRKSEPKLESEQSRHQTEQKPVSENEYEFEIKSTAEQVFF